MANLKNKKLAHVISVFPNKVKIEVTDLTAFKETIDDALGDLKIGSYLEISDDEGCKLIAIIESYQIELKERLTTNETGDKEKEIYNAYILEASPLGTIFNDEFTRGGDALTIPPTEVKPASHHDIKTIYENGFRPEEKFLFSKLSQDKNIEVPVNGNKFFNKHFAIVGSSGSGKSHAIAKILQNAINEKELSYTGLNNSHIVIFDIHNEYQTAFPNSNFLNISNLILPYWMLNSEELEELFLDTEANDHNQRNVFKEAITNNKRYCFKGDSTFKEKINYDTPVPFNFQEVLTYAKNRNNEKKDSKSNTIKWKKDDGSTVKLEEQYYPELFTETLEGQGAATGTLNGKLINFINRLESKINDKRLEFLLGSESQNISFEDAIKQFVGYKSRLSNVTIIDLSGVPFEVLSITVSLISKILFDYGYFYKKYLDDGAELDTPLLLVYEEAHKYVPKDNSAKFKASRKAIERIAKEGRKYGVTLGIVSQRPSEISETIFSQCNNFIAMRLTNPNDQNYVKKLLPDTLGNLIESLPALQSGEALLLGESIIMPSLVKIDKCDIDKQPSSNDVNYLQIWKKEWKNVEFDKIIKEWEK